MRLPCLLKTQFSVVLKTNGQRITSIWQVHPCTLFIYSTSLFAKVEVLTAQKRQ